MPIFSTYVKKQATGFNLLINRPPRENALAEISELLISYEKNILEVPLEEVEAIATRYNIDLEHDFYEFRQDIFLEYLRFCYDDYHLDWDERKALLHLAGMLYLNNNDKIRIVNHERHRIFHTHTVDAASDGIITKQEKAWLARLSELLELNHGMVKRIKYKVYTDRYIKAVKTANADRRVTDEEMKILEFIAGSMGLKKPHLDAATFRLFHRYRDYWLIENGRLPVYESSTALSHGEQVHFKIATKWHKRNREKYINEPRGFTHRIRHASAYTFNHSELTRASISGRDYEFIESGELQLTNQRLIFCGHSWNTEIRLGNILNVFPHSNGIDIRVANGRSPFLELSEDIDLLSMTLNRILLNFNC